MCPEKSTPLCRLGHSEINDPLSPSQSLPLTGKASDFAGSVRYAVLSLPEAPHLWKLLQHIHSFLLFWREKEMPLSFLNPLSPCPLTPILSCSLLHPLLSQGFLGSGASWVAISSSNHSHIPFPHILRSWNLFSPGIPLSVPQRASILPKRTCLHRGFRKCSSLS